MVGTLSIYLTDNLALFYTSHLYHQIKISVLLMRKPRLREFRNLYQWHLRKVLNPELAKIKITFLQITCPPELPYFSAHNGTGPCLAPWSKHTDLRIPPLSEGSTESEPSSSKSSLAESPDSWSFIYSLVKLPIKN